MVIPLYLQAIRGFSYFESGLSRKLVPNDGDYESVLPTGRRPFLVPGNSILGCFTNVGPFHCLHYSVIPQLVTSCVLYAIRMFWDCAGGDAGNYRLG